MEDIMSDAKTVVDRVWQIMEAGKLEELSQVVGPDCHFKMPGMEFRGIDALRGMLTAYLAAFPDLKHEVRHHVQSGDTIALELLVTGTHRGPMAMPQGTVPATGKKVTWESCDYVRVSGGKVVSWHVYHDPMPFLAALGIIPS
jgi:predicted ester cyclase